MYSKYNPDQKKRVTLAQIAEVAGVSKSAVSYVLSDKPSNVIISEGTRRRIADAAKSLGYRPNAAAKSLATGRSQTILMVVFQIALFDTNFHKCLVGAEDFLVREGYSIQICTVDTDQRLDVYSDIIHSGRADGVLHAGSPDPHSDPTWRKLREIAQEDEVPVVAFGSAVPYIFPKVLIDIDDVSGGEQAAQHLLDHGHKRILFLGVEGQQWSVNRELGYRAAHEKAGLPVDPDLVVLLGQQDQELAHEATMEIAQSKDFSAMLVVSDRLAVAALPALKNAGRRVPEDCAIVSFDDMEAWVSYTDPPLTSMHNPYFELGRKAAELLVEIINGGSITPILLPASLTIRKSCGCKP